MPNIESIRHYIDSYTAPKSSIGNLENILFEIKNSVWDVNMQYTWLNRLKDIITQEGTRNIYTCQYSNIIEQEKKVLHAIDALISLSEIVNEVDLDSKSFTSITKVIVNTYMNKIFPEIESSIADL